VFHKILAKTARQQNDKKQQTPITKKKTRSNQINSNPPAPEARPMISKTPSHPKEKKKKHKNNPPSNQKKQQQNQLK
jgi:hypothetical protein